MRSSRISRRLAIAFPGQGTQWQGMGRTVFKSFPYTRSVFEEVDEALQFSLSNLMFSKEIIADSDNKSLLSMTEYAQPAILTHSIAMLKVLEQECGIYSNSAAVKDNDPTVALGHSLGEYSALVATGSIALPDAARLVRLRGRLMQTAVPSGTKTAMAALMPANREVIESLISEVCHDLGQICAIANVNSKHQIVISGTEGAVREVANRARKVRATRRVISLDVSSAFHSPLMFPALPQLEEALHNTDIKIPAIPIIFNATGMLSTKSEEEIRKLLLLQLTSPVLWLESMHTARDVCKVSRCIEIGPGNVLTNLLKTENIETKSLCDDCSSENIKEIEKLYKQQ